MLEQILSYLNNWFAVSIHEGKYVIENGSVMLPFLKEGQYFRIFGSMSNDGLHQYPASDLTDEEFDGVIWELAVPSQVVKLSEDIAIWKENNKPSAFTSESFGGYSYSKATNSKGVSVGWREVFAEDLKPWKKIRDVSFVIGTRHNYVMGKPWNPEYPFGGDL